MDANEKQLIGGLFDRLSQAENSAPPRDAEADRFIQESVSRQPGAPYYMAQTIIVQEQALEAAQARIQELEAQASERPASGGGFLGSLFGGGSSSSRAPSRPAPGGYREPGHGGGYAQQPSGPWAGNGQGGQAYGGRGRGFGGGGGGGFLAGAAQTAVGVAGGVVLGSLLADTFFGDDPAAAAGDQMADAGADAGVDPGAEAASFDDAGGGDLGGFDDV